MGGATLGWGYMRLLYKAPTNYTKPLSNGLYKAQADYTKPQQTIQSPNRQYKAPTDCTKPQKRLYEDQKY